MTNKRRKPLISLKKKPKAPIRNEDSWKMDLDLEGNFKYKDVAYWATKNGLSLKYICFEEYGRGSYDVYYCGKEPDWAFDNRIKNYNKSLDEYNNWYSKHKNLIDKELQYRVEKAEAAYKKAVNALNV